MSKLLCFDLDGTVVDLCAVHRAGFEHGLGRALDPEEEKALEGRPTKVKCKMLGLTDLETAVVTHRKDAYVATHPVEMDWALKEALELDLGDRASALVTNSKWSTARRYASSFETTWSAEFGEPKPSPFLYLAAMAYHRVRPEDTVIFEDSPVGIEAAHATGARVEVVKNPADTLRILKERYL